MFFVNGGLQALCSNKTKGADRGDKGDKYGGGKDISKEDSKMGTCATVGDI